MRIVKRLAYLLTVCIIMVGLFGCATTKMYSGPKLPPDQVAFLCPIDRGILLREIDGKKVDFCIWTAPLEILPGQHTVTFYYHNYNVSSTRMVTLTFTAKAGGRYGIKSNAVGAHWDPNIIEIENRK